MVEKRGLGRGLDALLGGVKSEDVDVSEVNKIPVERIIPNPQQPRKEFDEQALADLSASIRAQGVLQPILVRPLSGGRYELVAGERRLRASKMAGLAEVPALIREMTEQESLAIALIENLQREDLNPIEAALGYRQLQEQFGLNQEQLAEQIGKSRSNLANTLRLLNLPPSVQKDIGDGKLTAGHGRAIMAVTDPEAAEELHRRIVDGPMSVRQAESAATHWKEHGELPEMDKGASRPKPPVSPGRKPKDPATKELESRFGQSLGLKVACAGGPDSGRITIKFSSREQLASLAEKLGVSLEDLE